MLCTVPIGAAAISGCGGDDGDSTAKERPRFSAAAEPPEVFIERTAKLLATSTSTQDCAQLNAISQRSYVRFSCPVDKRLRQSMKSFEVVGVKEYGTGAVVDYRSGKVEDGAAIVLFVAPDRNWGIGRFGVITEPSTKTTDEESRDSYEEAVDEYLAAVEARDCEAYREIAFISPDVKKRDVCRKLFASTKGLADRMRRFPDTEPLYEGGNATYGFFSFETEKPDENSTISLIKNGNRVLVLDVAPSPTLRQQRAVARLARQQSEDQVETSPQRKAD